MYRNLLIKFGFLKINENDVYNALDGLFTSFRQVVFKDKDLEIKTLGGCELELFLWIISFPIIEKKLATILSDKLKEWFKQRMEEWYWYYFDGRAGNTPCDLYNQRVKDYDIFFESEASQDCLYAKIAENFFIKPLVISENEKKISLDFTYDMENRIEVALIFKHLLPNYIISLDKIINYATRL